MQEYKLLRQKYYRVFIKGITWFFLNMVDKVLLAYLFVHGMINSVNFNVVEFAVSVGAYMVLDKLWEQIPFGNTYMTMDYERMVYADSMAKTFFKALAWLAIELALLEPLLLHFYYARLTAMQIVFAMLIKVVLFVVHERTWRNTRWGTRYRTSK